MLSILVSLKLFQDEIFLKVNMNHGLSTVRKNFLPKVINLLVGI